MKNDIAIIGLGTFGFELAVQLAEKGHGVLAIDIDEKKINAIKNYVDIAVQADITHKEVLDKLEINKFDKVIFCMSSALESIILAITYMKKIDVKFIIGKANTRIQKEILLKIGADEVVLPEISSAIRLSDRISNPFIIEKFEVDKENSLIEVEIPLKYIGKSLKELQLRTKYNVNVVMIKDDMSTKVVNNPEYKFQKNDKAFVIGNEVQIKKAFKEM